MSDFGFFMAGLIVHTYSSRNWWWRTSWWCKPGDENIEPGALYFYFYSNI